MSWREGADERIMAAIEAELDVPVKVASFVLVADVFRADDGDRDIVVNAAPDQRASTTLGLLELARAVEAESVCREWFA